MSWFEWFFDGLGSQLVSLIFGIVIGGTGGFIIGNYTKSRQVQKAGINAKQKQALSVDKTVVDNKGSKEELYQKQIAKDNAEQIQEGNEHYEYKQTDSKSRE